MWQVQLNDGRWIYQDDNRKGLEEHSAWIRLAKYLKLNKQLYIDKFELRFRDHIISIAKEPKVAYYFSKGCLAGMNQPSLDLYVVGVVNSFDQEFLGCTQYHCPSLEIVGRVRREILQGGVRIIWNNYGKK